MAGRKVRQCYGFARFRARSGSPLPLKDHPLAPRHLFRRRLRRSTPWTLDDTILVAAKRLIISKMLIILGAKWNEDFQEVAE